ncbi:MAG: ABC transporter ATP-binding protein [Desulfobacterales bacterium]|nr:MAG: ABC transporter ATP-binding protein [Desulfobacterales bacterium]
MASVALENVNKRYDKAKELAVDSLSLEVEDGEFLVILGPSGCGKSTVLRMIAGLETITSGTLTIGGKLMNNVPAKDRNIAMVFQSYALYPHMTVKQNLSFGLRRRRIAKDEIARRVEETSTMLGLSELLRRKPHALSGGQRQRVALGRAIVREPEVFLFDEPLSNLDAALRVNTRNELVKQHQRLGTTMIYVTHDQIEAMTMGERICIINNGRLVQVGKPLEVYRNPADTFVAKFLGNPPMNLFSVHLAAAGEKVSARIGKQILDLKWPLSELVEHVGSTVILGVRPEDTSEIPPTNKGEAASLTGRISAIEALGSETLVVLDIDGVDQAFRARLSRYATYQLGDKIRIYTDVSSLHIFDPQTSMTILDSTISKRATTSL